MQRSMLVAAALAVVSACGDSSKTAGKEDAVGGAPAARTSATSGADLTGAGATFPYPLYSKWFDAYATRSGVKINYQSIGSGGGIRQLSEQTVDFGASDAPMSDAELAKAKGGPVLHIPTALGAVVIGAHQRPHEPPRRLHSLDHPGPGAAMAARRPDHQHRFLIACRHRHHTLPSESTFKTQGRRA